MLSDFLILLASDCVYNIRLFFLSLFLSIFSFFDEFESSIGDKKGICTRNEYLHNVQLIMM